MADIVKLKMHKKCGKGGIHCHCCNLWNGKERRTLQQMVRRILKRELNKELEKLKRDEA
jgi:hypothetical protein